MQDTVFKPGNVDSTARRTDISPTARSKTANTKYELTHAKSKRVGSFDHIDRGLKKACSSGVETCKRAALVSKTYRIPHRKQGILQTRILEKIIKTCTKQLKHGQSIGNGETSITLSAISTTGDSKRACRPLASSCCAGIYNLSRGNTQS